MIGLNELPDIVMVLKEGRIESANQKCADFFGFPAPVDLVGKPFSELLSSFESQRLMILIDSWSNNEVQSGMVLAIGVHSAHGFGIYDAYYAKVEDGKLLLILKNNVEKHKEDCAEMTDYPNVQIINQEKLAVLGQLITGIVHEIFNPLGFIMSNIDTMKAYNKDMLDYIQAIQDLIEKSEFELAKQQSKQKLLKMDYEFVKSDIQDMFMDIQEGIDRINGIIKGLKYFSKQDSEYGEYDINNGIRTSLMIAKNEYKYAADLITILGEVPILHVNGNSVSQVILNLVVNAAHAIKEKNRPEKGLITVKSYVENDYVCVSVEDTGIGIKEENRQVIFKPFFTTKSNGVGTGLGLSLAYGVIVKELEGKIEMNSVVGEGTTFIVKIPVSYSTEDTSIVDQIAKGG